MAARCDAITRSGRPCSSPPLPGSRYCWIHDPASTEARREASRKGGRARSNQSRARKQIPAALTAGELAGWLSLLFKQTIAGKVEPKVATAAATIARTLLDAGERAELARIQEELDDLRAELRRQGRAA